MITNKVVQRNYIQIKGTLASPLLAGSGIDEKTQMDVTRNHFGAPFMTGSALAGAVRQQLLRFYPENKEQIASLFGATIFQSRLYVSDMTLDTKDTGIRDGVKLQAGNKVAEKMGKFDMEIVESGTPYTMRLEWITRDLADYARDEQIIKRMLTALKAGHITIGGKSNRGFGKLAIDVVQMKKFDYSKQKDIQEWLDWSWDAMKEDDNWSDYQVVLTDKMKYFELPLQVAQTLLIRDYRTEEDIDYGHLTNKKAPVIPGSTWAGAFRHRLTQILSAYFPNDSPELIIEELFGTKHDNDKSSKASRLIFEEAVVEQAKSVNITRNAIDRFSGATINGALFTGQPIADGNITLVIRWQQDDKKLSDEAIEGMLQWVSNDLTSGLLAIGGETAVGRGVFDAEEKSNAKFYQAAVKAIKERGGAK